MPFVQTIAFRRERAAALRIGVLLGALLTLGGRGQAQEVFDPSAIDRFDGKSWHNLTLGQSTSDDIKRAYKTSKGAYRPEGMVLAQDRGAEANVQVLTDGRGGSSRLIGFRLAYNDVGPDLKQLAESLGEQPDTLFPRERFSDWRIKVFKRSGITAFLVREGVQETVSLVVLTTPDRTARLARGLSRSSTPIGDLRARFNPNNVEVGFNSVLVTSSQQGLDFPDAERVKERIRTMARRSPGSPRLEYSPNSGGEYQVSIELNKPKNKEGTVSVSVFAHGDAPFGKVSASGYSSQTFSRGLFGSVEVSSDIVLEAFQNARDQMGRDFTDQIRRGLPSSPKAYREQVWNALVSAAVR